MRDEMTEAVVAYEEKPREQWLFDYPAQVSAAAPHPLLKLARENGSSWLPLQSCPSLLPVVASSCGWDVSGLHCAVRERGKMGYPLP